MIKVSVLEEKRNEDELIHWEAAHELSSENPKVIADFLRSVANTYDPPKAVTRSG